VTQTAALRQELAQTERAQTSDLDLLERNKVKFTELDRQVKKLTEEREALQKRKEIVDTVYGETLTKVNQLKEELRKTEQENQANKFAELTQQTTQKKKPN